MAAPYRVGVSSSASSVVVDDDTSVDLDNDAGAWISAGDVKVGFVVDFPARSGAKVPAASKIVELSSSKTGKHGGRKMVFVGLDLFTGKKREHMCMSGDKLFMPRCTRTDLILVSATLAHGDSQGTATVLAGKEGSRLLQFDADDTVGTRIMELSEAQASGSCESDLVVSVMRCRNSEKIVQVREVRAK